MGKTNWARALTVSLGMMTAALAPAAASATSFQISGAGLDNDPGGLWGTVYAAGLGGGAGYENAGVGRILLTGTAADASAVSFKTYCVDLFDWLGTGTFNDASIASLTLNGTRLARLTAFVTHADALVDTAEKSAAAQLGVWEILYETDGSYDVTSGSFSAAGGNLVGGDYNALTLANSWLGKVADRSWGLSPTQGLALLVPGPGNQPQAYVTASDRPQNVDAPAAVPEPATWGMMIFGFGGVGAVIRRRGTAVAAA
jgi:hypothetical protein